MEQKTPTDIMKSIEINNEEVRDLLNRSISLWRDDPEFEKKARFDAKEANRDDWTSDEYFHKLKDRWKGHDGFPEKARMVSLRADQFARAHHRDPVFGERITRGWQQLNTELSSVLGVRHNALCAVYPPGGFIGWHTNANASAYNLIMTWSETGDSYWKHYNPHTKEFEVIPDPKGWSAKATYFGTYNEGPENVVYHMASTECWRMTISYVFDRQHKAYWEDALAELEIE